MPAPSYGWPTQVRDLMDSLVPGQWMFTGSFAMYCYATLQSKDCRQPNDIDILVKSASVRSNMIRELCRAFGGMIHNDYVEDCRLGAHKVQIDVGVESAKYGQIDADCVPITVEGHKFPLISLTKLQACKDSGAQEEQNHNRILQMTVTQHNEAPRTKHTGDATLMADLVAGTAPSWGIGCALF